MTCSSLGMLAYRYIKIQVSNKPYIISLGGNFVYKKICLVIGKIKPDTSLCEIEELLKAEFPNFSFIDQLPIDGSEVLCTFKDSDPEEQPEPASP